MLVSRNMLLSNGCFLTLKLEILWIVNLDQTVEIHNNNLNCRGLLVNYLPVYTE